MLITSIMPEDSSLFLERFFQNLTGVPNVEYNKCAGPYGWNAEIKSQDDDVEHLFKMTKKWGPHDKLFRERNYKQAKATGGIGFLKLSSKTPANEKNSLCNYAVNADVITTLSYLEGSSLKSVQDKINEAIATQKAAKKLLVEEKTKVYDLLCGASALSYHSENNIGYDEADFNLIYDSDMSPEIRPNIVLQNSNVGFKARAKTMSDLPSILRPLELQTAKIEAALAKT
jgi:hypothetical protein